MIKKYTIKVICLGVIFICTCSIVYGLKKHRNNEVIRGTFSGVNYDNETYLVFENDTTFSMYQQFGQLMQGDVKIIDLYENITTYALVPHDGFESMEMVSVDNNRLVLIGLEEESIIMKKISDIPVYININISEIVK